MTAAEAAWAHARSARPALGRLQRLQHGQPRPAQRATSSERDRRHDQRAGRRPADHAVLAARFTVLERDSLSSGRARRPAPAPCHSRLGPTRWDQISMMRVGNAPVSWGVYEADRQPAVRATSSTASPAPATPAPSSAPSATCPPRRRELDHELRSRGLTLGSSFVPAAARGCRAARGVGRARRSPWGACWPRSGVRELIVADDEDPRAPGRPAASPATAARASTTRSGGKR